MIIASIVLCFIWAEIGCPVHFHIETCQRDEQFQRYFGSSFDYEILWFTIYSSSTKKYKSILFQVDKSI